MHWESCDCLFLKPGFLLWGTRRTGSVFEDPLGFLFHLPLSIIFLRSVRPVSPVLNCAMHLQWTDGMKPASPDDNTSEANRLHWNPPEILTAVNRDHSGRGSQFHPLCAE